MNICLRGVSEARTEKQIRSLRETCRLCVHLCSFADAECIARMFVGVYRRAGRDRGDIECKGKYKLLWDEAEYRNCMAAGQELPFIHSFD